MKLLIIEDEILIAAMTEEVVESYGYTVAAIAQNLEDALENIRKTDFDLAIVDINLGKGLEGLEVGRMLKQNDKPFLYLTSYESSDIIRQASETGPGTYLIKPYNPAQLLAALEVTIQNSRHSKPSIITLQDGHDVHQIALNDIRFVHADNIHVDIFTLQQRLTLRMSLKCLRELLPESMFLQPHRSYLVNLRYITRVSSTEICVGKDVLPIARGYKEIVLDSLANHPH